MSCYKCGKDGDFVGELCLKCFAEVNKPKRTPEEIIRQVCLSQRSCKDVEDDFEIITEEEALADLNDYYVLSDEELRELLPQKEELPSYACSNEDMRLELRNQWHRTVGRNNAIDLCFTVLQSRVPKALSYDELKDIIYVAIQDLPQPDKENALLYARLVKALSGRVPRGLSRERFRSVMSEHTPTIAEDSQQPEWTQGELDKAYDDLMGQKEGDKDD